MMFLAGFSLAYYIISQYIIFYYIIFSMDNTEYPWHTQLIS